mgnify:CR=1 FL=1
MFAGFRTLRVSASTALALTVVATGCSYRAGSFADTAGSFPGPRVALPCLDLAVALIHIPSATGRVIQYSFGNRCHSAISVDLTAARVIARDPSGTEVALHPYDPRGELRPLPLDGLRSGREQIAYLGPAPVSVGSICVDLAGVDRSSKAAPDRVCVAAAGTEVRR